MNSHGYFYVYGNKTITLTNLTAGVDYDWRIHQVCDINNFKWVNNTFPHQSVADATTDTITIYDSFQWNDSIYLYNAYGRLSDTHKADNDSFTEVR